MQILNSINKDIKKDQLQGYGKGLKFKDEESRVKKSKEAKFENSSRNWNCMQTVLSTKGEVALFTPGIWSPAGFKITAW